MFIEKVMEKIWADTDSVFADAFEKAMKTDAETLYHLCLEAEMKCYSSNGLNMNYIETLGCTYRRKNGKMQGCSMCNYQSEKAVLQGMLYALRIKSPDIYAKVVYDLFCKTRGSEKVEPNIIENITGYDSLDEFEMPLSLRQYLYGSGIFASDPFVWNIEARASSITEDRLKDFVRYFHRNKRVYVEFGVEVKGDFLRNQWLNKGITDVQIHNAVEVIHTYGCKAAANLLIGIPGLTEEQSVQVFVDSAVWLNAIGVDKIVVFPLNRKKNTLHGYMHEHLSQDPILADMGLVQDKHSGIPWIFTVIKALFYLYRRDCKIFDKVVIPEISAESNSTWNEIIYNASETCGCRKSMINSLNDMSVKKQYELLPQMYAHMKTDKCYKDYTSLLAKQKRAGSISSTLSTVGERLSRSLFGENWEKIFQTFDISGFEWGKAD